MGFNYKPPQYNVKIDLDTKAKDWFVPLMLNSDGLARLPLKIRQHFNSKLLSTPMPKLMQNWFGHFPLKKANSWLDTCDSIYLLTTRITC